MGRRKCPMILKARWKILFSAGSLKYYDQSEEGDVGELEISFWNVTNTVLKQLTQCSLRFRGGRTKRKAAG